MSTERHSSRRQGRSRRPRRALVALVVVGVAVAGVVIAWRWALPHFVERRLVMTLTELTGREVTLEGVAVDPLDADLTLKGLRIAGEGQAPVLESERVEADIEWRSLFSPGWRLASLTFHRPHLRLIWRQDARWNLARLFGRGTDGRDPSATPLRIRHIRVEEGRLDWLNRRPADPVTLSLAAVRLEARGYDNASADPFTLDGQADWNGGTLTGQGEMGFSPWTLDMDLSAEGVPLTTLSGYLARVMRARAAGGDLSAEIRLRAGRAGDGATRVTGDGRVVDLEFLHPSPHPRADRPLARARRLVIEGLALDGGSRRLEASRVVMRSPWLEVVIEESLGTNLSAWRPPSREGDGADRDGPGLRFALGELAVEDGRMAFADRHLPRPFRVDFAALDGEWQGLASGKDGQGRLRLTGQVVDGSPMHLEGALDPLDAPLQGDLALHLEDLDLTTFAPYLRHFGGYAIEAGRVTLDLDYRFAEGRLQAENHLVLRRIELGEQVEGAATNLPVELLVGVLQSGDGVIELDIPLTLPLDNLSAAEFGSILDGALAEALENLVSSPVETLSEATGLGDGEQAPSSGAPEEQASGDPEEQSPGDPEERTGRPNLYRQVEVPTKR